ncbi:MAG: hypothetical protein ACYSTY_03835 [Planctomycetota bacterium]|jgi:hypothetical protein
MPPPPTQQPQPLVLPRGLILLASIWLIGSWIGAIGLRMPVQPSAASYEPGVRLMLIGLTAGLLIGWPLLRLSQRASSFPARQAVLDLIVLLALVQVVIWPVRLVTTWSTLRTAALDATLTGWVVLAGAIVASTTGSNRAGPRHVAMAACVGMCVLSPAVAWLGVESGFDAIELTWLSPLTAVYALAGEGGAPLRGEQWGQIAWLTVAAVASWTALAGFNAHAARRKKDSGFRSQESGEGTREQVSGDPLPSPPPRPQDPHPGPPPQAGEGISDPPPMRNPLTPNS